MTTPPGRSLRPTRFRWLVLATIFLTYIVAMADRSNVGAVLPYIQDEFHISNTALGAISSFFFLGYAISQIPAGMLIGKVGTRGIVSAAVLLFSVITFLMGFTTTAIALILLRLLLGILEGPTPVGMTSTINRWFPTKEKGIATGVYIASTQVAPLAVPMIAVAIAEAAGWRAVFHWFAVPGVIMAIVFYLVVRSTPKDSPRVNEAEAAHIADTGTGATPAREFGSMPLLDRIIRLRETTPLSGYKQVLTSWNVWGITLAYFFMNNVLYGMITWVPTYLREARGFDAVGMGMIASTPFIGGIIGAVLGGVVSDKVFRGRRKPTALITALMTAIMMACVIVIPQNTPLLVTALVLTGFFLNIGWSSFTAYAMNLSEAKTYPFTIAVINSGGNLGGFFAPILVGLLLDVTGSYAIAFSYFVAVLVIGFVLLLSISEIRPRREQVPAADGAGEAEVVPA
ncbi:MFS transporter [Brachybacterium sp. J144]|uniref:MFS transporter n=1 Tax=Brachybacterium sp. J144 TaxID=3116487 RepID=UPI002E75F3A6|nr:MFS transporter [Brachybacterium sp. J144]MEE1650309.1 MFS transporter [Brachybacterium sp. J144]